MNFNPFNLIGTWKLISEQSEELLNFNSNGTYRIYYEVPFRMIELGEWKILNNNLVMICCNAHISCTISYLKENTLEFIHLSETRSIIKDNYIKVKN